MPGTLHLVATPIGNLEDITLRALRTLREAAVIAAEDTRRSAKLLAHYSIATPMVSYHEHNSHARMPQLLERLAAGDDVALVTDAGTPGVSDPGAELVVACVEEGIAVNPVPGASAPLAAAMVSGFPLVPLSFMGFPPSRSKDRTEWFTRLASVEHCVCFFEAPTRIIASISNLATTCGERPIIVCRELTKLHQEFVRGRAHEVLEQLKTTKGEFTVVIGPKTETRGVPTEMSDRDIADMFGHMTANGAASRRVAISAVARTTGRTSREVYAAVERAKKSVDRPSGTSQADPSSER
jgi:16S rRNA (cytidine1402-2'-O)-methyltransferase